MTRVETAPYTAGQTVEIFTPDFNVPGFPAAWHPATVTAVQPLDNGLFDVTILRDGIRSIQRVGKRGGNKRLRTA